MTTVHEATLRVAKLHARLIYLQTRLGYAQHKLIQAESDLLEHGETEPEAETLYDEWSIPEGYVSPDVAHDNRTKELVGVVEHWQEEIENVIIASADVMELITETYITE